MTRYELDNSTRRAGDDVVIGGSPLKLFRLSSAGVRVYEQIAAGDDVPPSKLVDRLLDAGAIHPRPGKTPLSAGDVTVVVPAFGVEPSTLRDVIACCPGVSMFIVVDDATDPPIAPVDGTRILRLRTNAGPAVARNAGLGAVTTPLVAFVDTDVQLSPGWLEPLLGHLADDRVALVAPRVASRPAPGPVARYEQGHSPLDLGPEPGRIAPGTRLSYVPAAALLVRTDALRAIGGFDRGLRVGEDVDAVWRLVAAGWRCRYEPAAVVHHAPRATWRALVGQRIRYGSAAAPLARRHRGALAPARLSGWSGGVWGLLAAGRPFAALGVAGATTAALVPKLKGVPPAESLRLAGLGHLYAGRALAEASRRAWWPLILAGAIVSRRARWLAAFAALPALLDGGVPRLVDDLAYGAGVWKGVVAEREPAPLIPDLKSWPGRSAQQ